MPTVRACCGLDDVMLWSYLLNPALKGTTIEELALEGLHHRAFTYQDAGWAKGQQPALGDPRLLALAGERVELLGRLDERLAAQLLATARSPSVYRDIEAPLVGVLMAMEEAGVALDVPFLQKMGDRARRRARHAREGCLADRRRGVQPRLAAAARRGPLREARLPDLQAHPQDEELLDRRRDAAGPRGEGLPARRRGDAAPRAVEAQGHLRRRLPAARRCRRPAAHALRAGGGGDRAHLVQGPQPAEHPGAHAGGAADPPRLRGAAGAAAAGRRLQPDRAAPARPHRRRGGDARRLPQRPRHPHRDGGERLRHLARAGEPRPAAGGEDDQLRHHLRHERLRAGEEPQDLQQGSRGLHHRLPRPLPGRRALHRGDGEPAHW